LLLEKAEIKKDARDVDERRRDHLWNLAQQAKIVATTVYSGLHRPELQAFFSAPKAAVVIDEAGMVPRYSLLPLLELLGGGEAPQGQLTQVPDKVGVVLAGDPRQLAPIFSLSNDQDVNSRYWLGESLMEELLDRPADALDPRTCLLREQSRMDPTICQRISRAFYKDQLSTVADANRPCPPLCQGWPEDGVVIVDPRQAALPADAPKYLRREGKRDERSLQVAVRLIREALASGAARSVLWLSPFRDQAQLARKLVDTHFSHANVRAGTVHTSQGGEADLVIFDPVSIRHRWLMGAINTLDIERLLNVAISRARGQVIVFTNPNDLAKNDLFRRVLVDAARWSG
jgi:hypothetical protein